ncbi:MAG: tail fiber domain-containing protein [Chitinophagaceae bacterium]
MKRIYVTLLMTLLMAQYINAQNTFPSTGSVGIGTIAPNGSAALEINSTSQGILISRMTKKQRDQILSPVAGLLIYQTNVNAGFYYYTGVAWVLITSNAWGINGNSGTISSTNFIGTTDAQALQFKINNKKAGLLDFDPFKANSAFGYQSLNANTGNSNSAFGYQSLYTNSTATAGTALGVHALFSNKTGSWNTAVGAEVLYANTTGYFNTATGYFALNKNTIGDRNIANGSYALTNNTAGRLNAATGVDALYANTTGSSNVANGFEALHDNTTGYSNVGIGVGALRLNTIMNNIVAVGDSALYNNAGDANTAIGSKSLYSNTTGVDNTAGGYNALFANTTGFANTTFGANALSNNTTGSSNTANGFDALSFNTLGEENSAFGYASLIYNISGSNNTSSGAFSLYSNTTGANNTANGYHSLIFNTTGFGNTAVGNYALMHNTIQSGNTAIGYSAGSTYINGVNNTFVGTYADVNNPGYNNSSAFGYQAIATNNNQIMLGNTTVNSVLAAGSYYIYSDARFKKNIKENVPGLNFINQLKPVTYNYDIHKLNDYIQPGGKDDKMKNENTEVAKINEDAIINKEKKLYTGFLAQDVEKAANKIKYDFSGLYKSHNDRDPYALSYADFVVPLVKAVQELSVQNDSLSAQVIKLESLKRENEALNLRLDIIEQKLGLTAQSKTSSGVLLSNKSLGQNIPNPFNHTTLINYELPQNYSSAKIIITDNSGRTLKEVNISGSGKGSLKIDASIMASGAYNYSLYINERRIGTKQMIVTK